MSVSPLKGNCGQVETGDTGIFSPDHALLFSSAAFSLAFPCYIRCLGGAVAGVWMCVGVC